MPFFQYKAVAPGGEVSVGELDAANESEILDRLRDQGLMPMQVAPAAAAGTSAAPAASCQRAAPAPVRVEALPKIFGATEAGASVRRRRASSQNRLGSFAAMTEEIPKTSELVWLIFSLVVSMETIETSVWTSEHIAQNWSGR